jgi:hypothetical protein
MSHNHSQSQASNGGPVQGPGPAVTPALDDEMLGPSDDEDEDHPNVRELRNLRQQATIHAQQMAEMQNMINQLTSQLMATPNEKPAVKKPKMASPEKYDGSRSELRTFLTNVDLYCEFNEVPSDQEKILMASTYMKGKASNWMQPYVDDYLKDIDAHGTRDETKTIFNSWTNFKEELGRIFGEVDAKNQAEKAITCLKQTRSVSAYTAEFKQLQARIDWDDAALRTVFEAGLKENVKDGLVHHDKPDTLHALIELATRIDNRLWERAQQKGRFQPTMANMKKQRNRMDRDGDTIMTGKVQTRDRKPRGKGQDGLSPEERKKRYDNKACLRCGEVGHFRRDCPKNEVKQAVVKVRMLKAQPSILPSMEELDETLSDLDLYEEARYATDEAFEMVQEAIGLQDFKWDEPLPTDWQVEGTEVLRRLRYRECWICGHAAHQANDCPQEGRITITGPEAAEIGHQAVLEQPRFKEHEEEGTLLTFKEHMEQHERLHWVDCLVMCNYHLTQREATRDNEDDCCHTHLWHNECRVPNCHMHEPEKPEAHEELCWFQCQDNCKFHKKQRKDARRVGDYYHSTISAEECIAKNCRMHRKKSPKVTTTMLRTTPAKNQDKDRHTKMHWRFCYDDGCTIHYDAKYGAGYFPRQQKRSKDGRFAQTKN